MRRSEQTSVRVWLGVAEVRQILRDAIREKYGDLAELGDGETEEITLQPGGTAVYTRTGIPLSAKKWGPCR